MEQLLDLSCWNDYSIYPQVLSHTFLLLKNPRKNNFKIIR